MKHNGYQIVSEAITLSETKWKEKIRSGELSNPSDIDRIKSAGIAPSQHQYLKGLAKGTRNINKKTGAEITHNYSLMGPTTAVGGIFGTSPVVNLPYKQRETLIDPKLMDIKNPMTRAIVNRHEADEGRVGQRVVKKIPADRMVITPPGIIRSRFGVKVGQHYGPEILDQEKQNVNFANSVYGQASDMKKTRTQTGEYDAIKNMSKKQLRSHTKPGTISTKNQFDIIPATKGFFKHPISTISKVKKLIDYNPGSGPIRGKGSSIPMTIGTYKQGAKMIGRKILQRIKR